MSTYDVNDDSVSKGPQPNLNNTTTSSSKSRETTLQNQICPFNESDKCTLTNNMDIFGTSVNRSENFDKEETEKRSTHTAPIVIPCAQNDSEGISGSKTDDTDTGANERTKQAKHVTLELSTDARITRDRNSHVRSSEKTGILKVRYLVLLQYRHKTGCNTTNKNSRQIETKNCNRNVLI